MKIRHPYFHDRRNDTCPHWARFDYIRRSRNCVTMYVVTDSPDDRQYLVTKYDARTPTATPEIVFTVPFSQTEAFSVACEFAEQAAFNDRTRHENHTERPAHTR